MIANRMIWRATKVKLHDYGCTLKAMTSDVAKELRLYGEMHRFIPAVASWVGARIARAAGEPPGPALRNVEVRHRPHAPRRARSHHGALHSVSTSDGRCRFSASAGLSCLFVGFCTCAWLAVEKLAFGARLADRPLLLLGVLLIVVGLQLLSLGLVADVVSRTYHESQGKRPYNVRTQRMGRGSATALPARPLEFSALPPCPPPLRTLTPTNEAAPSDRRGV